MQAANEGAISAFPKVLLAASQKLLYIPGTVRLVANHGALAFLAGRSWLLCR